MHLAPDTVVASRWKTLRPLGEGGLATVYLARDLLEDGDVALKLVRIDREEALESFRHEFATLSTIYHPHLVRVYDWGRARIDGDAVAFYTAAYVDGAPIDRYARGRPWSDVAPGLIDGLRALERLHEAGLRHGDFKPENILVDRAGRGTLIDLSCSLPAPRGAVSGTRGYLAPELLAGRPADRRADLFAVGVTLRALTAAAADGPDLSELQARLTRDDPAERPAEVAEVLAALGAAGEASRGGVSPRSPLVGRERPLAVARALRRDLIGRVAGPRVLWLTGPDGIGRSRVLEEIEWRSQLELTVVESDARRPDAVSSLLRRAVGDLSLPGDARLVLAAHEHLHGPDAEPVLLLLDDAHRLGEDQRALLASFIRLLGPDDPVGLVVTDRDGALLTGLERRSKGVEVVEPLELDPLPLDDLRTWAGGRLPEGALGDLLRVTGGVPGAVRAVLDSVRTGAEDLTGLFEDDLELSPRRLEAFLALDGDARRALLVAAALDGVLPRWAISDLELPAEALSRCVDEGWLGRRGRDELRLLRPGDAARLLGAATGAEVAALHLELARCLESRGDAQADALRHLALAGRLDDAERMLAEARPSFERSARELRRAVAVLAARRRTPAIELARAELEELCGDPRAALEILDALLSSGAISPLELDLTAAAEARRGSCHLKLGDARAGRRPQRRARDREPHAATRARIADLDCRAMIQAGDYLEAERLARDALDWAGDDRALRADLQEDRGVALSYLGRAEDARSALESAERMGREGRRPRARVRALSYAAILEYRIGRFRHAADRYKRALEIAEAEGLVDQAASCALNLGTVLHRRGDFGGALRAYDRGLTLSIVLGKVRAEVALRYDLAQLHCDVGRFDRALQVGDEARRRAEAAGLRLFVATCEMLDGEVALWQGRHDDAGRALERALDMLRGRELAREVADVELLRAETALRITDLERAAERLAAARVAIEQSDASDLACRADLIAARIDLGRDRVEEPLALLERARSRAVENDERDLVAEIDGWLAHACDRQGAPHAARNHRARALEGWDRCAATLPAHLRDAFWAHPRRRHVERDDRAVEPHPRTRREKKLERLLAINARLTSTLSTKAVLDAAMDAAVELTGAERGFVILAPDPDRPRQKMRVAAARNIDRETIGRSSLKFSRSIAEKVVETGEPVLSAEARSDERFSETRSVQAMKLKSVLSVPIRGPERILGALYVDNRFERGLFQQEDLEILAGFADQVGIALTNARLLDQLEARTRELERERRRIARDLEARSRDVVRLEREVQLAARASAGDYDEIVGRARPMRALFATLDRVSSTSLNVLIQGESGTGKELVARAIHRNGPRREGPFVTINCAALPETLLESELFGHRRGAFTGADRDKAGLFVHAGDGTILLDEIGELPLGIQAKLLRVLQEREVTPLGSTEPRRVGARVLCATNRSLQREVEAGRFREDLYYRIAVVTVEVPPLRERLEDLPAIARKLLQKQARELGRDAPTVTHGALRKLLAYDWPGNVRQLENVLNQALLFCEGDRIDVDDVLLPESPRTGKRQDFAEFQAAEAAEIAAALHASRWNVTEVSRTLGIPRTSLYRKLKRYGLERKR